MTTKYINPADTLADILSQKYLGMTCQINYDQIGHLLYGTLIWAGFEGMTRQDRQSKLISMTPQNMFQILKYDGFQFYTPEEMNKMQNKNKFNYEDFPFDIHYFEDSFAKAFPGMELQLEHVPHENKSYGAIIWDGFAEIPNHIRKEMVDSILRVIMHESVSKYIGNILAFTPEENKDIQEEDEKWDGESSLGSDDESYPAYLDEHDCIPGEVCKMSSPNWDEFDSNDGTGNNEYLEWSKESYEVSDILLNKFNQSLTLEEADDVMRLIFMAGFSYGLELGDKSQDD